MAPFGCLFFIFRSVATFVLTVVIFFSFLAYLSVDTVRDKFLTADFYTESFAENSIYDRFYDDVLLDEEFEHTKQELLGDIKVVSDDEIIELTKQIIEPSYLQSQVEAAVIGIIEYLNKDTDTPEVFIDLGPPLDLAKPVLLDYIDQKIDELQDIPVSTIDELRDELEILYSGLEEGQIPTSIPKIVDPDILVASSVEQALQGLTPVEVDNPQDFEEELEEIYNDLASAQLPSTIPSIENVPASQREQFILAYDDVVAALAANPDIPADVREQAVTALKENEDLIKDEIRNGDVEAALNAATLSLTGPVVDEFVTAAYDEAVAALEGQISEEALDGLRQREDAIKETLVAGDIKGSLKIGARALASPLIDEALDRIREELVVSGDQGEPRLLDLLGIAAEQNDQTRAEFLEQREVNLTRDTLEKADLGAWLLLLIIVLACLAMSAVHFPHLASGLRWPGTILLGTGGVFLIFGFILSAVLPGRVDNLIEVGTTTAGSENPIPNSMVLIISDVLSTMAEDVAAAWIRPTIYLMIAGVVLFFGSVVMRKLHIPFFSK